VNRFLKNGGRREKSQALGFFFFGLLSFSGGPQVVKNIDIFGATKRFFICNYLILSIGATKMYAGAIKMFYAGATKKSLTRARITCVREKNISSKCFGSYVNNE